MQAFCRLTLCNRNIPALQGAKEMNDNETNPNIFPWCADCSQKKFCTAKFRRNNYLLPAVYCSIAIRECLKDLKKNNFFVENSDLPERLIDPAIETISTAVNLLADINYEFITLLLKTALENDASE